MTKFLRNLLLGVFITLGIWAVFNFVSRAYGAQPTDIVQYSKLRAELLNRIIVLEKRIAVLEEIQPNSPIRVYVVDTVAGELKCRNCQFTENEKEVK